MNGEERVRVNTFVGMRSRDVEDGRTYHVLHQRTTDPCNSENGRVVPLVLVLVHALRFTAATTITTLRKHNTV